MNSLTPEGWTCPICHYRHYYHPLARACKGSWLGRLMRLCPPKSAGLHVHVTCLTCGSTTVEIKET